MMSMSEKRFCENLEWLILSLQNKIPRVIIVRPLSKMCYIYLHVTVFLSGHFQITVLNEHFKLAVQLLLPYAIQIHVAIYTFAEKVHRLRYA